MKEQTVLINNYLNGEIKLEDLVRSKSTFLNDRDLGIENFQDFLGRLVQEKIEREVSNPYKPESVSKNRSHFWKTVLNLK